MKVLIITYYWPPSGGSGVQRWLKFVKYLPSFGVTPYVFTPENPSFDLRDESLLKDVPPEAEIIHFPIWEPYKMAGNISGSQSGSQTKGGIVRNIKTWIRGNMIFPDPRVFWVKPAAQFLEGFLKDNQINMVITTGPPHSMHLIGQRLKKINPNLKWIADFRDPWSEWGMLLSFKLTSWAKKIHRRMEKQVLSSATRVITITPFYVRQLERLSGRPVDLITNGYDPSDFTDLRIRPTEKFVIRHVGLVNPSCDPRPFMLAVKELMTINQGFAKQTEIVFTGQVNDGFRDFVLNDELLSGKTKLQANVPHDELVKLYGQSSALLLVLTGYKDGEGFLPGKLFEYLATGVPIIAAGPVPSDTDLVLKELNLGPMISEKESSRIKDRVLQLFEDWKNGRSATDQKPVDRYSRKQLTFKLVELLKSL
jgi:glycosyltransferase involved in cell wall biosynthesis